MTMIAYATHCAGPEPMETCRTERVSVTYDGSPCETAYDGGEDDEKDRNHDAAHTEQEANEPHTCALAPRQPDARAQRRGDLNDENDDRLRRPALLAEADGQSKRYIDREERAREQLGTVPVVVVERPERE